MKAVSFESLRDLSPHEGGLNHTEVETQRARYGMNDIVEVAGHPWLELLMDTIKDPMIWFLVGIGTVFLSPEKSVTVSHYLLPSCRFFLWTPFFIGAHKPLRQA